MKTKKWIVSRIEWLEFEGDDFFRHMDERHASARPWSREEQFFADVFLALVAKFGRA